MPFNYPGVLNADHIAGVGGSYQPRMANNFLIQFYPPVDIWDSSFYGEPEGGTLNLAMTVNSWSGPQFSVEEVEIPFMNSRRYVAGRLQYEAGTLNCNDYIDKPTAAALYRWFTLVADPNTERIGLARDYKGTAVLRQFGPAGDTADSTTLKWGYLGIWPTNYNPASTLDYSTSDVSKIEVTFRYDKAYLMDSNEVFPTYTNGFTYTSVEVAARGWIPESNSVGTAGLEE